MTDDSIEKLGYSYGEAARTTSLGLSSLYELTKAGVIRVVRVGNRAILNGEDVRRVVREGHDPRPRMPPIRRGDEHYRSKAQRSTDQGLARYLWPTPDRQTPGISSAAGRDSEPTAPAAAGGPVAAGCSQPQPSRPVSGSAAGARPRMAPSRRAPPRRPDGDEPPAAA